MGFSLKKLGKAFHESSKRDSILSKRGLLEYKRRGMSSERMIIRLRREEIE